MSAHLQSTPPHRVGYKEHTACGKMVDGRDVCPTPMWITCPECCRIATQRAQAERKATADMSEDAYRCPGGIYQHGGSHDETSQGYDMELRRGNGRRA